MPEISTTPRSDARPAVSPDRDRLEYVADLLLELRAIAESAGCETLTGLLSLSHAEARRKAQAAGMGRS